MRFCDHKASHRNVDSTAVDLRLKVGNGSSVCSSSIGWRKAMGATGAFVPLLRPRDLTILCRSRGNENRVVVDYSAVWREMSRQWPCQG